MAVTLLCCSQRWLLDGQEESDGTSLGRVPGHDDDLVLGAAFVLQPIHVCGWEMAAAAPMPISCMLAPGEVYLFERTDGQPSREADAGSLWLAAIGTRAEEGLGLVVAAVWRVWKR